MEINSQLNDVIANIAEVASRVASTRATDIAEIQSSITSVNEIANSLSAAMRQQENTSLLVVEGLEQMKSVAARISAMDLQL